MCVLCDSFHQAICLGGAFFSLPCYCAGIVGQVYVFLAVYCLCGCFGVVAGCAMRRFQRYMIAWSLLLIVASLAPFAILLQLRLSGSHIAWALVLTPLFVNDAFLLCVAFFLVLFSCGAIEDAVFSLRQLCVFLCVVPASITFKVRVCVGGG